MALREIEKLRRRIQALTSDAGSLYDYLDRGRPGHEEKLKAHRKISEIEELLPSLKKRYTGKAEKLAETDPEGFDFWCRCHESATLQIEKETDDETARFVARQTREQWQNFRQGNYEWFSINSYFLREYDRVYKYYDSWCNGEL